MSWIWIAFWVSFAITIILFFIGLLSKARDPAELIDGVSLGKLLHFPTREPTIALEASSSQIGPVTETVVQSRQLETTLH